MRSTLQNWNWRNWAPNLIAFDANPLHTFFSVKYYLENLLNAYRGTEPVQVLNSEGDFGPLCGASTIDGDSVFLKVMRDCIFLPEMLLIK